MAHKKRERKEERRKFEEPDVKQIITQIESSVKKPSQKEIEEYEIAAIAKRVRGITEQISEKAYRKAHEDAKTLAGLLDKGDPKYLNRWG